MAKQSQEQNGGLGGVLEALPTDELMEQVRELASALGERAVAVATDKVGEVTERLVDYVANGGTNAGSNDGEDGSGGGAGGGGRPSVLKAALSTGAAGLKQAVSNKLGGGGGGAGGGKKLKVTNIVEEIDIGLPVRVVYDLWTQFQDFPKFTKRLEQVEQTSDEKLSWKAGIFLSHRTWEATIVEQVPDESIVWRSKGEKGSVDGTVTFHELAPNLTRVLLVLEYHPQGLFERTGNLWRAQGRRTRLELKHFRRHAMTHAILDPDAVEGWRGEIRDGEVVRSHEDAVEDERDERDEGGEQEPQDEDEPQDEEERDEEAWDEEGEGGDEGEYDDEEQDEADYEGEDEDEDRYEDEDEDQDEDGYEDEDEDDEREEEPARRGSRRAAARKG